MIVSIPIRLTDWVAHLRRHGEQSVVPLRTIELGIAVVLGNRLDVLLQREHVPIHLLDTEGVERTDVPGLGDQETLHKVR